MILDDIKNSITKALYKVNKEIAVYFDDMKNAAFPFCNICLADFRVEACASVLKTKYEFVFQIVSMKSRDNYVFELLEMEELLKKALFPCIKVKNKKITLEDVTFKISDKKLLMDFKMSFYEIEDDETELMQILDITMKENKNAR